MNREDKIQLLNNIKNGMPIELLKAGDHLILYRKYNEDLYYQSYDRKENEKPFSKEKVEELKKYTHVIIFIDVAGMTPEEKNIYNFEE